ncbi:MAG: hypothetical protein AAF228_04770 [Pseudomonadota bacterium]
MPATDLETLVLRIEANTAQAQKQMNHFVRQNKQTTKRIVRQNKDVAGSFQRTAQSIAVLHGPLGGIASRFSSLSSLVRGSGLALAGFTVAVSALTFGMSKLVREFAAFEVRQKTTEGLLRATGFAAGKTAHDIEQLSQNIGLATLASTQGVREAANALLTFRTISGTTFNRTLNLAQDLAASGFGNLKTSTIQLAKALEDPMTGLTSLRRIGVNFSIAQQDLIKSLHNTGQTAKAQKVILDGVARQMSGAGVAAADSLAGAFDTVVEAGGRTLERWGQMIAEGTRLKSILQAIGNSLVESNSLADNPRTALRQLDARISQLRKNAIPSQNSDLNILAKNISQFEATQNQDAINRLYQQRLTILGQVIQLEQDAQNASESAQVAQGQMAKERFEAVVKEINEKKRLKTLSEEQILTEKFLGKAGVEATSERGQAIAKLIEDYIKLSETQKSVSKVAEKSWDATVKAIETSNEQAKFFAETLSDALSDVILEGGKATDVIRDLGKVIARAALQSVFTGSGPFSNGANQNGGLLNSLFSGIGFAKGAAFNKGAVKAFAKGGIVHNPTLFPMRGGQTGLMGEDGPEAILPLARDKSGNLGVRGGGHTIIMNFNGPTDKNSIVQSESQISAMLSRAVTRGRRNL